MNSSRLSIRFACLMVLALLLSSFWAAGVEEIRHFESAEQEALYQQLTAELRCLVCQNQNIADSSASLAEDLRDKTYELILAGQQEADIKAYMQRRFGDFVLYEPPVTATTWLLWGGPVLVLGVAISVLLARIRLGAEPVVDGEGHT